MRRGAFGLHEMDGMSENPAVLYSLAWWRLRPGPEWA